MRNNKVLQALHGFSSLGYDRVSLSELQFKTKLPRSQVINELRHNEVKTHENNGELYITFAKAPQIQAYWLSRPKSRLLGDQ